MAARTRPWLRVPGGARLQIKPGGLLIGRAPHCDAVLTDPGASRVQAIVFDGPAGPTVTVLGKGASAVNGEPVAHERDLVAGDRLELPGAVFEILEEPVEAAAPPSSWVVRGPGGLFGVVSSPFTVGSGARCDLRLDQLPPQLLRFHLAGTLHVEALAPLTIGGVPCAAGELHPVGPGAVIACDGGRFEVVVGGTLGQDSTAGDPADDRPSVARLEFLARGGRLTVVWRAQERTVYLPEKRCDLVASLLQPPPPYAPGDFIPDDIALPRIWPGRTMSRVELNVLIHRARHDLVRAELDGTALLERAGGGNATRFLLARDARVIVA